MPYIITVTSGKEKLVRISLAERLPPPSMLFDLLGRDPLDYAEQIQSIDSSIAPFSGFLVCETIPLSRLQEIRNRPHIHGVTEATAEQIEKLKNGVRKQTETTAGMMVKVMQGEHRGLTGIVRTIVDNDALVDLSVYGKMIAVRVPVDAVKGVSHED